MIGIGWLLGGMGYVLAVIGYWMCVYGCCMFARSKGYPAIVGLLGLLWIPGLIVLALLPNQNRQ